MEESAEKMGLKWATLSQGGTPQGQEQGCRGEREGAAWFPEACPPPSAQLSLGGTAFSASSEAFLPGPSGDLARRGN